MNQSCFIVNWNLRTIFIQENAFENAVWKIAAILSRHQYVGMAFLMWYMAQQHGKLHCIMDLTPQCVHIYNVFSWPRWNKVCILTQLSVTEIHAKRLCVMDSLNWFEPTYLTTIVYQLYNYYPLLWGDSSIHASQYKQYDIDCHWLIDNRG